MVPARTPGTLAPTAGRASLNCEITWTHAREGRQGHPGAEFSKVSALVYSLKKAT